MEWPGETVLVRVVDALEKGIGGALRPWQTRRVAKANVDARIQERLLIEQAELDIADLKAGRKTLDANGKLVRSDTRLLLLQDEHKKTEVQYAQQRSCAAMEFSQSAREAAQAREMQRAVNLKKIALYAEEEAEEIDQQSDGYQQSTAGPPVELDNDWFAKWRAGAQEVSKDEMQRLWGKLLAGEIARPSSYTLHTVDFLSRMSSADAELIARIAPFVTSGGIIKVDDDYFKSQGVDFQEFLYLNELGLINGTVGVGGLQFHLGVNEQNGRSTSSLVAGTHALIFDIGDAEEPVKKLAFDVFALTRVGKEILTLTSISIDMNYMQLICDLGIAKGAEEVRMGLLHPDGRQVVNLKTMAIKKVQP